MDTLQVSTPMDARKFLRFPPLSKMVGFDRRRHDRFDTRFKAKISAGDEKIYCDVLDMSEGGARVRPHSGIDPKSVAFHVIGIGSWLGDVVWSRDGELGLQFRKRMDSFTLSSIL